MNEWSFLLVYSLRQTDGEKTLFFSPLNNAMAWAASVPSYISRKTPCCVHGSCFKKCMLGLLSYSSLRCFQEVLINFNNINNLNINNNNNKPQKRDSLYRHIKGLNTEQIRQPKWLRVLGSWPKGESLQGRAVNEICLHIPEWHTFGAGIRQAVLLIPTGVKFQQIQDHLSTFTQKNYRFAMNMKTCFIEVFTWEQKEYFLTTENYPT